MSTARGTGGGDTFGGFEVTPVLWPRLAPKFFSVICRIVPGRWNLKRETTTAKNCEWNAEQWEPIFFVLFWIRFACDGSRWTGGAVVHYLAKRTRCGRHRYFPMGSKYLDPVQRNMLGAGGGT